MTGWNLPPGVGVMDIPGNRPEDVQAELISEGWRPRCTNCGGYLPLEADGFVDGEVMECDGVGAVINYEYDESSIRILGEEYRGRTYPVRVTTCGLENDHEPHREVMSVIAHRTCKSCGARNEEVEW